MAHSYNKNGILFIIASSWQVERIETCEGAIDLSKARTFPKKIMLETKRAIVPN
ncbi:MULTISPECIES: hypothetical protein [Microcoleaceae]|uniref:hypothetical protein n=1 Tax=Microcoleaceae TaxID=1892252 RepID=UPI0018800728|nr:hypothetical protein [Tychonema sp. LEGE 06208]MBE9162669.1 hypothetical protein [Tychonema sp. LEGE 06208]